MFYQQIHFNQIKLKIAANGMSNAHVSPDVLSNLMLLQQGKRYELQQQILHTSSESVVQRFSVKKMLLKLLQNSQK